MKRPYFHLFALVASLSISSSALSQIPGRKPLSARDLYYAPGQGQQGSKISIKLNRGGTITMVPPGYRFRSGDQIRLVFSTNFTGYVGISNQGSTGAVTLLYPPAGDLGQVTPSSNFEVPGQGWLQFDNKPGRERLVVVLSPKPIPVIAAASSPATPQPAGATTPQQQAEILAQLNSKALEETRRMQGGRDLSFIPDGDSIYANSGAAVQKPWGFELFLAHE